MRTTVNDWPSNLPFPRWYLDAVSGAQGWEYVEVRNGGGQLEALLPFQIRRRWGLLLLMAPPLCPQIGPVIHLPESAKTEQQKNTHLHRILTELNAVLPPADYYKVSWPYSLENGLPWQMLGWQQKVRYSYVLPLGKSTTQLWKNLKPSLRNKIRKAEGIVAVQESQDWKLLFHLVDEVFLYRGVGRQVSVDQVEQLYKAADQNQACQLWTAVDEANNPHAAMLLLYDDTKAYNLLLGSDPALRQSGAVPLLLWHAIRWAKDQGLTHFDFEGSHLPGVEPFFRSFGAEAWPYYEFIKGKSWLLALRQLRGRL